MDDAELDHHPLCDCHVALEQEILERYGVGQKKRRNVPVLIDACYLYGKGAPKLLKLSLISGTEITAMVLRSVRLTDLYIAAFKKGNEE